MHTYLKRSNTCYGIGLWLINQHGHHQFTELFTVTTLRLAFKAVNALNGGESVNIEILKLEEAE